MSFDQITLTVEGHCKVFQVRWSCDVSKSTTIISNSNNKKREFEKELKVH